MNDLGEEQTKVAGMGYTAWALIYAAAIIGAVALHQSGLVTGRYSWLVMLAPMLLVPFMTRAQTGSLARRGISSPALNRYNMRIMASVLVMVFAIVGTVQMGGTQTQDAGWALLLSALVVLPAIGCVWSMIAYLREEEDEFLRHRATGAALFALGFVLVCGAVHGSLQLFGLAWPANSLWVLPAWAFGIGFGNLWHWMRGR